ncbi:MAG: hypothetical protein Q9O24_11250 [Gammaproteobacteria bacterium]|nr:hypothetical protein [Gammaproteobacteria bacterium]
MNDLPSREQQVLAVHAEFIIKVVQCSQDFSRHSELDELFNFAQKNGWGDLVAVLRKITAGQRETSLLLTLDKEDSLIATAILRGLQDPNTLPTLQAPADAGVAAPGLAAMIHAAAKGDVQALEILGNMAQQMQQAGGDMKNMGGLLRRLINGERNYDQLGKKLGKQAESLLTSLLAELGKLEAH